MYVESPFAIRGKFDTTTYRKGAIVLKMLKDALSEKIFLNGIKIYLNEMQFKSVSPEDLYRALQQAYDEAFPGNDLKIEDLMQTWTNSKGLPIVTVSRSENGLLLTQDSLGTENNELFSIPINYATASNQNFDNFTAEIWMTTKEIEITRENAGKTWTDDDWIIFNLRDTGYYLTNYDETLWGLITTSLANDHEAVHYLNRGTLFADIHRFIEHAIDFRATILLEMIDSLKLEFHPHVWRRADMGLLVFQMRLRGSELHGMYLNFLQQTMNEIHGREFETLSGTWATETVNSLSCHSGVKACEDDALGALVEVMETGVTSFQFPFRCNGFRVANETVWMHFFNTALAIDDGNWNRMFQVYDLECTQNPEFIKFYLDTVLDMTNNLRMSERQEMIRIMARENNVGYNAIIELVEENPEFFNTE